jgi:hypothetical protein
LAGVGAAATGVRVDVEAGVVRLELVWFATARLCARALWWRFLAAVNEPEFVTTGAAGVACAGAAGADAVVSTFLAWPGGSELEVCDCACVLAPLLAVFCACLDGCEVVVVVVVDVAAWRLGCTVVVVPARFACLVGAATSAGAVWTACFLACPGGVCVWPGGA